MTTEFAEDPLHGVEEIRLDNGFRALLQPRPGLPVVSTALFYTVGSRDERSGETGVSHFLEHMMFKGTDRYPKGEIDAITTRLGGSNNAYTDHDTTCYHFSLAADRWFAALEIEASRMRDCLLDDAEFAAEKNVVLEELAMGQDDPWRPLWEAGEWLAWRVHPYQRPIIGHREDLERLEVGGMRSFYGRHYGPNRACLVAAGDLDVAATTRRLEELFGGFDPVEERQPVLAEPEQQGEVRGTIRAPGSIPRIAMATRCCRMGEREDFVLDLLSMVLGSGRSSRLHRRLVLEEELATSVSTTNETRLDPGLFWVLAELRPDADPERAEAVIREELDRVVTDGVRADELRRSRVLLRSAFLFDGETALGSAMRIGHYAAVAAAGHQQVGEVLATYDSVDRRELREVAARVFEPGRWTVTWSLPEGQTGLRPRPPQRRRSAGHATVKGGAGRRGTVRMAGKGRESS